MMLVSTTSLTPYPIVGMTKRKLILTCLLAAISWRPAGAVDLTVSNTSKDVSVTNSLPWAVAQINSQAQSSNTITFEGALDIELDNPLVLEYPVSFQTDAAGNPVRVTRTGNAIEPVLHLDGESIEISVPEQLTFELLQPENEGEMQLIGVVGSVENALHLGQVDGTVRVDSQSDETGAVLAVGSPKKLMVENIGETARIEASSAYGAAYGMVSLSGVDIKGNLDGTISVEGATEVIALGSDTIEGIVDPESVDNGVIIGGSINGNLIAISSGGDAFAIRAEGDLLIGDTDDSGTGNVTGSVTVEGVDDIEGCSSGGNLVMAGDYSAAMIVTGTGTPSAPVPVAMVASPDDTPSMAVGIGAKGYLTMGSMSGGSIAVTNADGNALGIGSMSGITLNGNLDGDIRVEGSEFASAVVATDSFTDQDDIPDADRNILIDGNIDGLISVASEGDATVMMADGSLTVTGDLGGNLAASSSGGSASGMVAGGPVSIGSMSGEVEVSGAIEGLGIVSEDAVIISGGIIDGDANYETLNFDISGGQFAAGIGADNRVEIGGFDGSMNVESSSGPAVGMFSFRELELDGNLTGSVSVTGGGRCCSNWSRLFL